MDEEIINLATYDFDTTKLEASLERLQKQLFETKKRQEEYGSQMAAITKEQKELQKQQEELIKTGKRDNEQYQSNKTRLNELRLAQEGVFKSQKDLQISSKTLNSEYAATAKSYAARLDAEGKLLTSTERATAALQAEITTIESARAANSEILKIRNQLNPSIIEEANLLKQLNSQYDENTNFIKENASAYENVKMNIGNYTESIINAYNEIEAQKKALEDLNKELILHRDTLDESSDEYKIFNQQINNNITQINVYASEMKAANGEVTDLKDAQGLLNGSLGDFVARSNEAGGAAPLLTSGFAAIRAGIIGATQAAIAFIATPIGAVIAALAATVALAYGSFKFMTASMNSTEEGAQALSKTMAKLSGFFDGFFKVVKPIGEYLGKYFIDYINDTAHALDVLTSGLANTLDFVGFDSAAESIRGFQKEISNSATAAYNLSEAEGDLDEALRKARITQLSYQKDAEKLRQLRDDESRTIPQRIKSNEQLGVVLKNQLKDELAIANQRLKVAELNIKSSGRTKESLDQEAEARTEIIDIQERLAGQESEQLANLNSLRRESAAIAKTASDSKIAADRAALDSMIKNMDEELKYFIALQDGKSLALQDSLKQAKGISERETAINELQYKKGLVNKKAYELRKLEIQNEYTKSASDATIANTDLEIQLFKERNKSFLKDNQFFSEELYFSELNRINSITKLESDALKQRFDAGVLSKQEYDLEILRLDNENFSERERIANERIAASKIADANNIQIERDLAKTNLDYDLQAQLDAYDKGYEERKKIALSQGITLKNFEAQEAANRIAIEENVNANKRRLASDTLSNLITIFGEQSKIGKAAAIAQTTIDTYQSATAAFKSLVGIPIVGPALAGIAAAAAVASGLSNVKKISAVKSVESKRPSYATGVIGLNGTGTGTSDNIPANLSLGESVITAQATSMFPNTLSAMNMLGGGNGIDNNSVVQNTLMQDAFGGNMANQIAEAVAIGAAEGTARGAAKGIVDLSENRNIQNNAKF